MRILSLIALALAIPAVATAGNPPDPRQTNVVATGRAPCGIAARAGSVWVGVYETGELLGIDDTRGQIHTRAEVGRCACRLAVGPGAIWIVRDRPGELVRVSRGTGRMRRTLVGSGAFDVLLAEGSVWTTSNDTAVIAQMDPGSLRLEWAYKDGAKPAGLTRCNGRIWVGHGGAATWLTRIDPSTHRLRRIEVGSLAPGWPRCIRGVLWVTAGDVLLKVDATSGKVRARVRLGGTLAEAAEGPDALVWVTDKERSLVHRVWAGGASVTDEFEAGPGAYSLARAGDAMWITSFAGSDVRRFDP